MAAPHARSFAALWRRIWPTSPPASPPLAARPGPRPLAAAPAVADASLPEGSAAEVTEVGWREYAPRFAPFAQALGLDLNLPLTLSETQRAQVESLAELVRASTIRGELGASGVPNACMRVLTLAARGDVELNELTSAVHQDPVLTAAVLRVANSALAGPASGEVRTVRDAIMRLGLAETGRIVGAVAARTLFSSETKAAHALFEREFLELQLMAANAAAGAAELAMQRGNGRSDVSYLAGMLHDVGKSLALGTLASLVLDGRAPRELAPNVLAAILERHHVELGAQALESWGLPRYLIALCAAHHDAGVPHDAEHGELHVVRAVSGLLALRARPQVRELIEQVSDSLAALSLAPLQARALDASMRNRSAQLQQVLGLGKAG